MARCTEELEEHSCAGLLLVELLLDEVDCCILSLSPPSMERGANNDDKMWSCELLKVDTDETQKYLTIVEPLLAVHSPSIMLVLFSKMVVAPLVHLDGHDVDVELTIELSNPYLDVELVVVDNVVQLVLVLLDVDVELIVLNCCDPLFCCCTLEMPIPDVARPELKRTC